MLLVRSKEKIGTPRLVVHANSLGACAGFETAKPEVLLEIEEKLYTENNTYYTAPECQQTARGYQQKAPRSI